MFDENYFQDLANKVTQGLGIATGEDAARTLGGVARGVVSAPAPAVPQSTAGAKSTFASLPGAVTAGLKKDVLGVPAGYLVLAGVGVFGLVLLLARRR